MEKNVINVMSGNPDSQTSSSDLSDWKSYISWKPNKDNTDSCYAVDTTGNYCCFLIKYPKYQGSIRFNDYSRQIEINGIPITDCDISRIRYDIDENMHLSNQSKTSDALNIVSHNHSYHPVKDYLTGLQWDGTPRVETFFVDWLGAEDTKLNRTMTKLWFIGGVKRMFQPGCKNDNLLVTVGVQGCGKTYIMDKMTKGFGYENHIALDNEQEYGQKLDKCWVVSFDELDKLRAHESSTIKNWLSIRTDIFRIPYGKVAEEHHRHCIYYGTSNDTSILKDYSDTLERRWWIIPCSAKRDDARERMASLTDDIIDQIWAETMQYYNEDKDVVLDLPYEYYDELSRVQRDFKTCNDDSVVERLTEILDRDYILQQDGQFLNDTDAINQMKGNIDPNRPGKTEKIQMIPSRLVSAIMKDILREKRSHNFLKYALRGKWDANVYDNKLGTKVYRRIDPDNPTLF